MLVPQNWYGMSQVRFFLDVVFMSLLNENKCEQAAGRYEMIFANKLLLINVFNLIWKVRMLSTSEEYKLLNKLHFCS